MCFLPETLHSPRCEYKARVIRSSSFLAESEEVPELPASPANLSRVACVPFDPQVLRWLEGTSEDNEKGHQFSKVEMKQTKPCRVW